MRKPWRLFSLNRFTKKPVTTDPQVVSTGEGYHRVVRLHQSKRGRLYKRYSRRKSG